MGAYTKLSPAQSVGQIVDMLDQLDRAGMLTPPEQRMSDEEKKIVHAAFQRELAENTVVAPSQTVEAVWARRAAAKIERAGRGPNAPATLEQVREIRRLRQPGLNKQWIADCFGISLGLVQRVLARAGRYRGMRWCSGSIPDLYTRKRPVPPLRPAVLSVGRPPEKERLHPSILVPTGPRSAGPRT